MKTQYSVAAVALGIITAMSTVSSSPNKSCTVRSDALINCLCKAENVMYPVLLSTTLKPFSCRAKNKTLRLTQIAVSVSLTGSRNLIKKVSNISRSSGKFKPTVENCEGYIGDARDNVKQSVDQIKQLSGNYSDIQFQLNSVQTWMGAAMTSVGTCMDEANAYGKDVYDDVAAKKAMDVVINGTTHLTSVLSNSLAVVNLYVDRACG